MILSGKSLCERQRDLNYQVNQAAQRNINFEEVKNRVENTDIDKLFKIDLASKYKNIDYIIETLKSGDDLAISRALKCVWLYDDAFAVYINPIYIQEHLIPFMSNRMKNKFIKSIALYLKNPERAEQFYNYCTCPVNNLSTSANNFLIRTSESFKLKYLHTVTVNSDILKSFIGTSFVLAEAYINRNDYDHNSRLYHLRHLYTSNREKYLDFLEKYKKSYYSNRYNQQMSKDIMKKFKDRTLEKPNIYIPVLHYDTFLKYITSDDAKIYLIGLLPDDVLHFWSFRYRDTYKYIIDKIPFEERYRFLKEIFTNKYPKEEYDMSYSFYSQNFYIDMSVKEREEWALRHLASKAELLGADEDYNWYKFINYEKAFLEIKKIILITPDAARRSAIVNVLIASAKDEREIERLLNYYYERHVNEDRRYKEEFLRILGDHHIVFYFKDTCWTAYDKILYCLDVYNPLDTSYTNIRCYRNISLIYHIITDKPVPTVIQKFLEEDFRANDIYQYIGKLSKKDKDKVYLYILEIYLKNFSVYDSSPYTDEIKESAYKYINLVQGLMGSFEIPEEDTPEIIKKYMQLDTRFKHSQTDEVKKTLTEGDMIRFLKKDAALVVSNILLVEQSIEKMRKFKLNQLVRKLRIYFPHDTAQDYLEFCENILQNPKSCRSIRLAVYGIFQLADDSFKSDFMTKFTPSEPKINHSTIIRNNLYIQESICRYACFSRPPVPLSHISKYIKGDYVHYCVPMFNTYMATLPPQGRLEFVKSLLDTAVSVQKHGLRYAFKCFTVDEIIELISKVWKKTKNVSIRMILYTSLYTFLRSKDDIQQRQLFEVLKFFTSELNQDDHDDVISLLTGSSITLPNHLKGEYLEVAWNTIKNFPDTAKNSNRRVRVISSMNTNLTYMEKGFVKDIVDNHIHKVFVERKGPPAQRTGLKNSQWQEMNVKWHLSEEYISTYEADEETLEMVRSIMQNCLGMWNEVQDKERTRTYVVRQFCFQFIKKISSLQRKPKYTLGNPLLEVVLKEMSDSLPIEEIYTLLWNLRTSIIANKIIDDGNVKIEDFVGKNDESYLSTQDVIELYKEIAVSYAREVADLITELIRKKINCTFLFYQCIDIVLEKLETILNLLKNDYSFDKPRLYDMRVFVASALIKYKIKEMYFLAVGLLPLPTDDTKYLVEDYNDLVNKIKSFNDNDIKCYMLQKFVDSKYKQSNLLYNK